MNSHRHFTVKRVSGQMSAEELEAICTQMQPENWAADNDMTSYEPSRLRTFLHNDQNLLVLAYEQDKIVGAVLCYIMPHPSKGFDSLYVHELDTHPDYRRQGVSTLLMQQLMEIAKQHKLDEVWVSTETTNLGADAFYRSLKPYEVEPSYVYAYKIK